MTLMRALIAAHDPICNFSCCSRPWKTSTCHAQVSVERKHFSRRAFFSHRLTIAKDKLRPFFLPWLRIEQTRDRPSLGPPLLARTYACRDPGNPPEFKDIAVIYRLTV